MELHHGLAPDYEPNEGMDRESALAIGTHAMAERVKTEKEMVNEAFAKAEELFALHPDGLRERQLIHEVRDTLGIPLRLAVAAVDSITSSGKAKVEWATGFMTHTK